MNLAEWIAAILVPLALIVTLLLWWRGRHLSARSRRSASPATRPWVPPRTAPVDRVRQDIDDRVQTLRRARERAERWVPPAVDAVASRPPTADWADTSFADTTQPGDEPPAPARPT